MIYRLCFPFLAVGLLLGSSSPALSDDVFEINQLPVQTEADAQTGGSTGIFTNAFGHIAGIRSLKDGDGRITRAFLWNGDQAFDIGTNGQSSDVRALNDLDQVVVTEFVPPADPDDPFSFGQRNAYFWDNGTLTAIGSLGGANTIPNDLNNAGKVVGASSTSGPFPHRAFLWTRDGGIRNLGTLGGTESNALAINELDQVVGWSFTADGSIHGFFWSEETGMKDIGPIDRSGFLGINDNSQIAGMQRNEDGTISWFRCNVFIADDGTIECQRTTLHKFGESNEFVVFGPTGMNNSGQIIGLASHVDPAFDIRLAIWEPDGSVTLQPDVWDSISGTVLNDSGHVVFNGVVEFDFGAYFWNPGSGKTVRLPTLAGKGAGVGDLNAFDEITGGSADSDGVSRAVVWRPLGPLPEGSAELLALIEVLKELWADDEIFEGDAISLLSKLTAADSQLREGKTAAAKGLLEAAQNQIAQLIRNVFIDPEVGGELYLAIGEILSKLE